MLPRTTLATAALAALTAATASAPVWADETYEQHHVRSNPEEGSPQHVTLEETRAAVRSMPKLGEDYYRELDFRVNDKDDKVRVR